MTEITRQLIDISSEHLFARPKWDVVSQAKNGDVLIKGKRIIGVVYSASNSEVNICYADWGGVLHSRRLSASMPSRVRGEFSDELRIQFGEAIYAHAMPSREFNLAESFYGKYQVDSKRVISASSGGGG